MPRVRLFEFAMLNWGDGCMMTQLQHRTNLHLFYVYLHSETHISSIL